MAAKAIGYQTDAKRKYAGLRHAALQCSNREWLPHPRYTPAHRSDADIAKLDCEGRRVGWGNKTVDQHAKDAVEMHPAPTHQQIVAAKHDVEAVRYSLLTAATVLPLFPVVRKGKAARHRPQQSFEKARWHKWSDDNQDNGTVCAADGVARCVTCFCKHEGPDRPLLGCTGPPTPLKKVTEDLGHCIRLK